MSDLEERRDKESFNTIVKNWLMGYERETSTVDNLVNYLERREQNLLSLIEKEKREAYERAVKDILKYEIEAWVGELPHGTQYIEPVVQSKIIKSHLNRLDEELRGSDE